MVLRKRQVIIDVTLILLAGILAVASLRQKPCFLTHAIWRVLPYVMVFFAMRFVYGRFPEMSRRALVSMFELTGLFEACLGGWQWIRMLRTGSGVVLGTFSNSGPYGGFLAMTLAISFCHIVSERRSIVSEGSPEIRPVVLSRVRCGVAMVSGLLSFVMLPVSLSRAGWVAALVAMGAYIMRIIYKGEGRKTVYLYLIPAVTVVLVASSLLILKQESALGRFHIWEMESRVMLTQPFGVGIGNELGAYGDVQAAFFSTAQRSPLRIRIAGCPEFAFNEYLKVGMQGGIICFVLAVVLVILSIIQLNREAPELGCGMMALSVFATASYPLEFGLFQLSLALFLAVSSARSGQKLYLDTALFVISAIAVCCSMGYRAKIRAAEKEVQLHRFSKMGISYHGMSDEFAPYHELLSYDYRYLYEYGYALHKESRFIESNQILSAGAAISCDPMFHNVMGLNYQQMRDYDHAEAEFLRSRDMVPYRIVPLYFLMLLYQEQGRADEAREIARQISDAPINPKNRTMVQIQERVMKKKKESSQQSK